MNNTEYIRLSFPVSPVYVSSARLTVSSIANRVRFNLDEIEDIKTAVSEACTYIIGRSASPGGSNLDICFAPRSAEMFVEIVAQDDKESDWSGAFADGSAEMSLVMIKALVDEFTISKPTQDKIYITMLKKRKEQ